ncbi:PQQ-binding-like beta-propeller repeat protein [Echinicola sp. CAU 1574]|uniref:PQQ-binding-like beta-propeller repeat protein n=1 Tax=Echinicola arenosa TaxID=2774144 RepID=A0ABR9AJ12_9BACT|nr:PQQ-binding-like beta-propeller repeat protein [Echinicola arenosa]MBD8487910.1 PQQ-binding-like beta-propeller repeat protein [Echinicola arenosa]
MKKLLALLFVMQFGGVFAQNFKFAFVTDTHINDVNDIPSEDLRRTVDDINTFSDLDFVLLTGDITEMGTDSEIKKAKEIITKLNIPFYIIPGNHDTGWSESGGVSFIREFGYDKFVFEHEGYKFIGTASGPYVRMSDGHIPRDAVVWVDSVLAATPKDQRIINVNHYPLDNSLDNWFELTDRLKEYNTQFSICGHGHRNKDYDFEGIPGVMGRSNLRAKDKVGGYNIVEIHEDTAYFSERTPGVGTDDPWRSVALGKRDFKNNVDFDRPDYSINQQYDQVKKRWSYHSDANVISTPAVTKGLVIYGNSTGKVEALSQETGKLVWSYQTGGGVFSSPAVFKHLVILGSGDGYVYAFNSKNGKLAWKTKADASVLGSPIVDGEEVYIGSSDGKFRALNAKSGKVIWEFEGLEGPVVSKPLVYDGKIYFGAWDKHLYALNLEDGSLAWKWNNGSPNRMYSPAMCIPVAYDGVVYIVAPDRYITALEADSGETLWRSNEATVRESIGISEDKQWVYGKTMNDEIVAFSTGRDRAELAWKVNCGFGYEHVPSMIIEKDGAVYFGTKNSRVYSIDPIEKNINWVHKVDNSMANTVNVIDEHALVVATMDGKIEMLDF